VAYQRGDSAGERITMEGVSSVGFLILQRGDGDIRSVLWSASTHAVFKANRSEPG
jgi:hypothetical protein